MQPIPGPQWLGRTVWESESPYVNGEGTDVLFPSCETRFSLLSHASAIIAKPWGRRQTQTGLVLRWTGEARGDLGEWKPLNGQGQHKSREKVLHVPAEFTAIEGAMKSWKLSLVRGNGCDFCWHAHCTHHPREPSMAVPVTGQSELEFYSCFFFLRNRAPPVILCIIPRVFPTNSLEILQDKLILFWSWERWGTGLNVIGSLCYLILPDFIKGQEQTIRQSSFKGSKQQGVQLLSVYILPGLTFH